MPQIVYKCLDRAMRTLCALQPCPSNIQGPVHTSEFCQNGNKAGKDFGKSGQLPHQISTRLAYTNPCPGAPFPHFVPPLTSCMYPQTMSSNLHHSSRSPVLVGPSLLHPATLYFATVAPPDVPATQVSSALIHAVHGGHHTQ